jgi:hypothetical protein
MFFPTSFTRHPLFKKVRKRLTAIENAPEAPRSWAFFMDCSQKLF